MLTAEPDLPALPDHQVQRRTVGTLVGSQMLGGIGMASGIAVGSLLAEDITGSAEFAGLGGTFQVLGGALIAIPMARVMGRQGRRPGLVLGYALGVLGAVAIIASGVARSFPLLLLGSAFFGGATASNSQARYAAADLAEPQHRGRDLSIVVWATTIGSVLGPNLVGPAGRAGEAIGIPALTGPFLFSLVGFVLAVGLLAARLRPDPLLLARRRALATHDAGAPHQGSVVQGMRAIAARPAAVLGLVTLALGHTVMVSVMVMTPLHLHHGGAALRVIGLVISIHIVGMFALSPLTGMAVDRFGGRPVAVLGSAILLGATLLAAQAPTGWSAGLTVALFLLGVGWSCTLVSGSTLLAAAIPIGERAGAQGASDLAMGLAAGGGGALAGVVVGQVSYSALALGAAGVAFVIGVTALTLRPDRRVG
ncbi:MFS transporter [Pedococcus sp. 5OH_020]|uniref:MFS transporter n=1 Tax=Pedococcus sp. 5OH_020 TaxID=2989814 RepID=UPI0022E9F49C|nr:MFS transporter [Pedococcus sp. 5OH_020]